jgi:DNA-binding transcriptional MerR regulator
MGNNIFSIGATSKIKGITIKALRFYEKTGLVKPHHTDRSNKYRYYSLEQFFCLDIIKAARAMDISIKDLKSILARKDTNELMGFLDIHRERINNEISSLQSVVRSIEEVQRNIKESLISVSNTDVYIKEIPERIVVTSGFTDTSETEDILAAYSRLDRIITDNGLTSAYGTGIIFEPNERSEFYAARCFNTVADMTRDSEYLSVIPAGKYACVCYNKENAGEQQVKMIRFLQQNNLTPRAMLQADLLNDVFEADTGSFELQALI